MKLNSLSGTQASKNMSSFFLLSLGAHAVLLLLLLVPAALSFLGWRTAPPQSQILQKFNVELVDVTFDDVNFNPKDFEQAQTPKAKRQKTVKSQPKDSADTALKSASTTSTQKLKLTPSNDVVPGGQDPETTEGDLLGSEEVRRILMSYKDYLTNYLNSSKQYPRIAEKLRQEGMVVLELEINEAGIIKNLKILKSSSFKILDTAALEHVKSLSPFKKLPDQAKEYRVEVPIVYQIN